MTDLTRCVIFATSMKNPVHIVFVVIAKNCLVRDLMKLFLLLWKTVQLKNSRCITLILDSVIFVTSNVEHAAQNLVANGAPKIDAMILNIQL